MFFLVAGLIAFFLIGFGIVVGAIVMASIAVLISLGIVSSAVIVGIVRRRFSSALRTFHYLVCAVITLPAGVAAFWLVSHLITTKMVAFEILTAGSVIGLTSGLALAFLFDQLAGIIYRRFANSDGLAQSFEK